MKRRLTSDSGNGVLRTRREFMRTSMLGAAAAWSIPAFLSKTFGVLDAAAADAAVQTPTGKDSPILVVLQMAGGNDGLNTIVPYADDAYHRARPVIGIPSERVLKVNDYLGMHPNLTGLKSLYDEGHLGIVQGVGYPNPNRSHFRSTEIWQTASDAEKLETHGWLGNYFDACCQGEDPTVGVAVMGEVPLAFAASKPTGIAFSRPEAYRWINSDRGEDASSTEALFRELNSPEMNEGSSINMIGNGNGPAQEMSALDFLQRTALDAQLSSDKVLEIARKTRASVSYPKSRLADNLQLVARMIAGGLPTRVYYVSQGGYDTHNNQEAAQPRLLLELSESIAAFAKDLQQQGNFDRVVLMTFSEFGRRVAQNASNGTDHGAAGQMFIAGGKVKPGLFGNHPSLTDLNRGDLIHNVDFRSVYATLLDQWMHAPSEKVLGRKFSNLPLIG